MSGWYGDWVGGEQRLWAVCELWRTRKAQPQRFSRCGGDSFPSAGVVPVRWDNPQDRVVAMFVAR